MWLGSRNYNEELNLTQFTFGFKVSQGDDKKVSIIVPVLRKIYDFALGGKSMGSWEEEGLGLG